MTALNMTADTFISIDDQTISLREALGYLRASGDLQPFLMRILRQHVIQQELEKRADLEVDASRVEQAIINFRLQNQLVNGERFDQWLQSQGLNYTTFRNQVTVGLKLEQLKNELTEAKTAELFEQNQVLLEQVILSRIVLTEQNLAEELKRKILEDEVSFESVAKEYSTTNERLFNGMMGAIAIGQLPPEIRSVIEGAQPGDIVGPVEFQGRYSILRLEQRIPATLEGQVKQNLQEQLFDQWWQEQLKNKAVKLHVE